MRSIERTEQKYLELLGRDEEILSSILPGQEEDFRRIVAADLEKLDRKMQLAVGPDFPVTALKLQAVKGHMSEGHGLFYVGEGSTLQRVRYPFKTFEDIVAAAGWNLSSVMQPLERDLSRIRAFVDKALETAFPSDTSANLNRSRNIPFTLDGKAVVDVHSLSKVLDPKYFLEGFVIGSYVDNFKYRKKAAKNGHGNLTEPYSLGGGESYFFNLEEYWDRFGSHAHLHQVEHTDDHLEMFSRMGLITEQRRNGERIQFVRRKSGYGTSDDLTLILVGKLYRRISPEAATSAMAGVYVADLVDTLDKHGMHPLLEGHDEHIANEIQQSWKKRTGNELVPEELITFMIYHAAKATHDPLVPISSSQRRLLQYQGQHAGRGVTTVLDSHHQFVLEDRISRDVTIGFTEVKGRWFYSMAARRASEMNAEGEKTGLFDFLS